MDRPSGEEGKQTDAKMAINFTSGVGRKEADAATATAAHNFVAVTITSSTAVQGCRHTGLTLKTERQSFLIIFSVL